MYGAQSERLMEMVMKLTLRHVDSIRTLLDSTPDTIEDPGQGPPKIRGSSDGKDAV